MTFVFFCGMSAFSWSPPAESKNALICCRCSLALAVLCNAASKADKVSGVIEGRAKRTCQTISHTDVTYDRCKRESQRCKLELDLLDLSTSFYSSKSKSKLSLSVLFERIIYQSFLELREHIKFYLTRC